MKNKKAITTFEMVIWMPRIVFIVIIMFAVMVLIRSFVTTTVDVSELQANVFAYRVIYSPNSISYYDKDMQRAYPGVIDFDKFKSQEAEKFLENSINYGQKNKEIAARLLLKDLSDNNDISVFYNEDFFKEQEKLAYSGFTEGPGGARLYVKKYEVLISKNGIMSNGKLTMEIVVPNS